MSRTSSLIIELVNSLPAEERREVVLGLSPGPSLTSGDAKPPFVRVADGQWLNPQGLDDDNPFFGIMRQIEAQRHLTFARPDSLID